MEDSLDEWYSWRTPCLVLHDSLAAPFLIPWLENQLLCQPLLLTKIERYLRSDRIWQRQCGIDPTPTPSSSDPLSSPSFSTDRCTTPRPSESTPRRLTGGVLGTPPVTPTYTDRPSLVSIDSLIRGRPYLITSRRLRRLRHMSPSSPTADLIQRRSCVRIRGLTQSPAAFGADRHRIPLPQVGVQLYSPSLNTRQQPQLKYRRLSRIVVSNYIGGQKGRIRWTR